jgi:peptidoglycan/xylan/chitin deacetylase (PgdA/CDA1 family)/glycosyltransferase involved in cell wall biosynthesis
VTTPAAFVIDDLETWDSTAERLYRVVTALDRRFAPEVIVLGRADHAQRFSDADVPVRRLAVRNVLRLARALRSDGRRLAVSWRTAADLLTPLAAAAVGAVAVSARGDVGSAANAVGLVAQRRVNHLVAGMTAPTAAAKRAVIEREGFPAERIRVVPDAIDVSRYAADPTARARMREALGLRDADVVIGALGDVDLLLPIAAATCRAHPSARFLVHTSGPLGGEMRSRVAAAGLADRVVVSDAHRDEPAVFQALDLFLSTSHADQSSSALREAIASGLAVVATDENADRTRNVTTLTSALDALVRDPVRAMVRHYEDTFDAHIEQGARPRRRLAKGVIASGYRSLRPLLRTVAPPRGAARALILCYHSVVDDIVTSDPSMVVTQSALQRQLETIGRHYTFVDMASLAEELAHGGPRRPSCAVTFDDGYQDNLALALPILLRVGAPATVFLTTGAMDHGDALWPERIAATVVHAARARGTIAIHDALAPELDGALSAAEIATVRAAAHGGGPPVFARAVVEALKRVADDARRRVIATLEREIGRAAADVLPRYLTWAEARALHDAGVTLGSHTVTHPILPMTADDVVRNELREARALILARVGVAPRGFAYPNGDHDARTRALVSESGHDYAVTLDARTWSGDRFAIGRRCVAEHQSRGYAGPFSAATFLADMEGALDRLRVTRERPAEPPSAGPS